LKWSKHSAKLLYFLFIIGLVAAFIAAILFLQKPYSQFIDWVVAVFGQEDWRQLITEKISDSDYSTIKRALYIATGVFAFIVLPLSIWKYKTITNSLAALLSFSTGSLTYHFGILRSSHWTHLLAFVLISIISLVKAYYYVFTWPVQYDEAWTHLIYLDSGPLLPLLSPHNNHVLYTVVASLFQWLPFTGIENSRIILPILGLASAVMAYFLIRKYLDRWTALLGYAFLLSSTVFCFYQLYARSYIFMIFFAVVTLFSFMPIAEGKSNKKHYFFLAFCTALGLYSTPSFIYWMAGMYVTLFLIHLFNSEAKKIVYLLTSSLGAVVIASLLYSPIIVNSGMDWLVESAGKNSGDIGQVRNFMVDAGYFFTGYGKGQIYVYLLLLSVSALLLFSKDKVIRYLSLFNYVNFLIPLVLAMVLGPMEDRYFSYLIISVGLTAMLAIYSIAKNNWNYWSKLAAFILLAILFLSNAKQAHEHGFFNWSLERDYYLETIADTMIDHEMDEIYCFDFYAKPALQYHYNEDGLKVKVHLNEINSVSYSPWNRNHLYDGVLWRKTKTVYKPDLSEYQLIYADSRYELYSSGSN